ncbi:hypothetical protein ASF84_03645 [Pseudomonas sp. Leaf127]|uniref:DUF6124 family protein n=1 Tax=Pseudomonas TaxID=286 RepID=UPI0007024478|nr:MULTISPECIES: DUF3077 domain-containing protein [Pseudomonas]KQQ68229.1 hypothetical protein ASF84_03645 [Pseudomonas sp. Leaf127]
MLELKPTTSCLFSIMDTVTPEAALNHASDLLRCIIATAGEGIEASQGPNRDLNLAVLHLSQMAKMLVDRSLDSLFAT